MQAVKENRGALAGRIVVVAPAPCAWVRLVLPCLPRRTTHATSVQDARDKARVSAHIAAWERRLDEYPSANSWAHRVLAHARQEWAAGQYAVAWRDLAELDASTANPSKRVLT